MTRNRMIDVLLVIASTIVLWFFIVPYLAGWLIRAGWIGPPRA